MDKQLSMSALSDELQQVRTKKKEFLSEIDRIVPWGEWINLIQPHYYKGERGNKSYDLELMLRRSLPRGDVHYAFVSFSRQIRDGLPFSFAGHRILNGTLNSHFSRAVTSVHLGRLFSLLELLQDDSSLEENLPYESPPIRFVK